MLKKNILIIGAIILTASQSLASQAGMPQFDPEFWLAQIFWLGIIFTMLYVSIWKIFIPKISANIENRKAKIVNDLDQAEKMKKEAEKKLKEYDSKILLAKHEALKIINDGRKKNDADLGIKRKKIEKQIEEELIQIENKIKIFKKDSIGTINKIATEVSTDLIKKIMGTQVNSSNVVAIVEQVTKEKFKKLL